MDKISHHSWAEKNISDMIFDISMESAQSRSSEVYIYELSSLGKLIGEERAELVRDAFLENNTTVYQMTNTPIISPFTENDPFVNKCMKFRYVPKSILAIEDEVLIFDDTVVIYNHTKFDWTDDAHFAKMQRSLFLTLWWESASPEFAFEYHPPKSYYMSTDMRIYGRHAIVYADKDAPKSYDNKNFSFIQSYIESIIRSEWLFYDDADYFIIFLWNYEGAKMVDVWKYTYNTVDAHSWPLSEARTYKEWTICTGLGIGSGSTLLILGYEERIRRQSKDLESYFSGPAPRLPFEMIIEEEFFTK
jgi:hypothetical protein